MNMGAPDLRNRGKLATKQKISVVTAGSAPRHDIDGSETMMAGAGMREIAVGIPHVAKAMEDLPVERLWLAL
jgi:hypothetical protein